MSIRTIIEINHDQIVELREDTARFKNLLLYLMACDLEAATRYGDSIGARFLGQRHHSEPEWVQTCGDRDLVLEALRIGRVACEWAGHWNDVKRIKAATEIARTGHFSPASLPVPVAKITVDSECNVTSAELYAPGLPAGKYDLFLEHSVTEPSSAQAEVDRPSLSSLRGMAPGAYGGLSSTDYVERVRNGEWSDSHAVHPKLVGAQNGPLQRGYYRVRIRQTIPHVRPSAEQVDGKVYFFAPGWVMNRADTSIYVGESTMIPMDPTYPVDAPSWIASGDLVPDEAPAQPNATKLMGAE